METGRVLSVNEDLAGTTLAADAAGSATEILVNDTEGFDEDGGRLRVLSVNGNATFGYVPDDDAVSLRLDAALGFAVTAGEEVRLEPLSIERYALVGLEDAPDAPILARVPHGLIQRLPAGIRDESDREAVSLEEAGPGAWVVTDVIGRGSASPGYFETDWANEYGVQLLGGQLGDDVPFGLFGAAVVTPDIVISYEGPSAAIAIPKSGSGTLRKIGQGGDTADPLALTLTFPTKITCNGHLSVSNLSDTVAWNARLFLLAVDTDTGTFYQGRPGTDFCGAGDGTNGRERQVVNDRQVFFDASPDAPRHLNWWWALQQDSADTTHSAIVTHAKMTLRISYAPDVPTTDQPNRSPAWTDEPDLIAAYKRAEGDTAS